MKFQHKNMELLISHPTISSVFFIMTTLPTLHLKTRVKEDLSHLKIENSKSFQFSSKFSKIQKI